MRPGILSLPIPGWDYKHLLPHSTFSLGAEYLTSCLWDKPFTNWAISIFLHFYGSYDVTNVKGLLHPMWLHHEDALDQWYGF